MTRLDHFRSCSTHPWYRSIYARLSTEELAAAEAFIAENDSLDRSEFEMRVNRMWLDKPKPKNWSRISELLTVANGRHDTQE